MGNFITGLFTLLAAFGGIWLKDFLDQKKASKTTRKQKAVEAYSLIGKLMHSLNMQKMICSNLINNKNYPYMDVYKNNPDTSSDLMEKIELLIVENFYDLKVRIELLNVEETINSYSSYLNNIMITFRNQDFQVDSETFADQTSQFDQTLIESCHKLRSILIDDYINASAPRTTFYSLMKKAKKHLKLFFTE